MKSSILLLALATVAFSSCTTAYKTGQTPDDVYYSPARPVGHDEYVRVEDDNDREYRYDEYYYDDRYLRMKVQNRNRWNELDDWYYFDRYRYSYYNSSYWGNPWSPNVYWNNYYNPYCQNYVVVNPKNYTANRPRTFNLNTYNNNNNLLSTKGYTNSGSGVRTTSNPKINTGTSGYSNSSSRGGVLRDVFNGGSSSSSSSSNNNSSSPRTSSSSSSSPSSSGSSGGGGGSAPVRKF